LVTGGISDTKINIKHSKKRPINGSFIYGDRSKIKIIFFGSTDIDFEILTERLLVTGGISDTKINIKHSKKIKLFFIKLFT